METDPLEFHIVKFNGGPEEHMLLWSPHFRAVLESTDLGTEFHENKGAPQAHQGAVLASYEINVRRARVVIVTCLRDKRLRAI